MNSILIVEDDKTIAMGIEYASVSYTHLGLVSSIVAGLPVNLFSCSQQDQIIYISLFRWNLFHLSLIHISVEEYVETVKDKRYKNRSEMRVFARQYASENVYIKIRVELLDVEFASGGHTVFVLSFHFAEEKITGDDYPYRKPGCVE